MSIFRFIGAFTEIGTIASEDTALKRFGQSIELADQIAHEVMLGGGALLPESAFDAVGFTEQELSIYSDPLSHAGAHEAFLAKKKKAILAYLALVRDLRAPEKPPVRTGRLSVNHPPENAEPATKSRQPNVTEQAPINLPQLDGPKPVENVNAEPPVADKENVNAN